MASGSLNRTEIFNEICMVLILYCMMLFTHFVEEARMRYNNGFAYITIGMGNLLVHLIGMTISSILKCR